ncbi:MAG: DUF2254 family protein [Chloroflexota bacterium]
MSKLSGLVPWLVPALSLAIVTGLLLGVSAVLGDPTQHFEIGALGSVQFVLNTNAAALTSAMSVLIALVLLTVQLTAQRYSFNIIGIFIHNPVNAALIAVFIVTITFNLWLGLVLQEDYLPTHGILMAVAMTTVCFALLPPYIKYLFDILRPEHVLNHLRRELSRATNLDRGSGRVAARRASVATRINQIGDIARTAVGLTDSAVARHSVWVLFWAMEEYLDRKPRLPAAWFEIEEHHFRGRHELIRREIEETLTWTERRMLDEVQEVYFATLNKMHDVNNTVALVVRQLGEKAVETSDLGLLRTVMKFFNTFLRAAINQGDTRSGYHALYQYRLLADTAMDWDPRVTLEIADRISYYGDAAGSGPLLWMAAAAAYDLRILAENAYDRGKSAEVTAAIVNRLIETVSRAEAKRSPALIQLYKTTASLGSFFLARGERALAGRIREVLAAQSDATLSQIGRELGSIDDPIFWELTDRVVNFDYVEDDVRRTLPTFLEDPLGWPLPDTLRKALAPEETTSLAEPDVV